MKSDWRADLAPPPGGVDGLRGALRRDTRKRIAVTSVVGALGALGILAFLLAPPGPDPAPELARAPVTALNETAVLRVESPDPNVVIYLVAARAEESPREEDPSNGG